MDIPCNRDKLYDFLNFTLVGHHETKQEKGIDTIQDKIKIN